MLWDIVWISQLDSNSGKMDRKAFFDRITGLTGFLDEMLYRLLSIYPVDAFHFGLFGFGV
jgi:hypothetical protein